MVPTFGKMKLSKLETPNIQALYTNKLARTGPMPTTRPIEGGEIG